MLVQRPQPDQRSLVVAIHDTCLRLPRQLTHQAVLQLVDIYGHSQRDPIPVRCRPWLDQQDFTHMPFFEVEHGTSIIFEIIHGRPVRADAAADHATVADADSQLSDDSSLLQRPPHSDQPILLLNDLIPAPPVDCQRVLFLRHQFFSTMESCHYYYNHHFILQPGRIWMLYLRGLRKTSWASPSMLMVQPVVPPSSCGSCVDRAHR